jgi:hypothetical protein
VNVSGRWPGGAVRRAGCVLAGAALVLAGLAGAAPAAGSGTVLARLGPITVSATALRPGPAGTLTASVQVSTSGQPSDQLDAAIAADGAPVGVYHQRVNVGELPDLAGCGAETPTPAVVDRWLHYGPLLVPGRSGGSSPPAVATLTVAPGSALAPGAALAITLYFAQAGSVLLRLPVSRGLPAQLLGSGIGRPVSQDRPDGQRRNGQPRRSHEDSRLVRVTGRRPRLVRPRRIAGRAVTVPECPKCMLTIDPGRAWPSTVERTASGPGSV